MITDSLFADLFLLAMMGLLLIKIYRLKRINRFLVFDPLMFFWVGVFVIYIVEVAANYSSYVIWYGEDAVLGALLWIFIGIFFLHIGYRLRFGRRLAQSLPELPPRLSPNRLLIVSMMLTALGLIGWYMQIMTAGSFAAWAAVPRGGEDWEKLSGYVTLMASFLAIGISILVLHVEMHRRRLLLKLLAWVLLLLLLLFFVYLGSRSRTIATVVVALMAWSLPRRKNPSIIVIAPLFMALYLLTSFQAEYRGYFKNFSFNLDQIDWSEVPVRALPSFLTGMKSESNGNMGSEFGLTAAVVSLVPEKLDYNYGYEFLQIVTNGIPRSVWPEKPYPRGEAWSDIHLLAGTSSHWVDFIHKPYLAGPSPGYIASWLYIGGAVGLLVGGLLTGVFLRTLRGVYDRSQDNEGFLVLYLVLAPIGFGEATGHPFSWIYALPLLLLPLLLGLYLIKKKHRLVMRTPYLDR